MTIHDWRKTHKVYVMHMRLYYEEGVQNGKVRVSQYLTKKEAAQLGYKSTSLVANAGITSVEIYERNSGKFMCHGVCLCGRSDAFNRKLGVKIALGRAEKYLMKDFQEQVLTANFK